MGCKSNTDLGASDSTSDTASDLNWDLSLNVDRNLNLPLDVDWNWLWYSYRERFDDRDELLVENWNSLHYGYCPYNRLLTLRPMSRPRPEPSLRSLLVGH